MSIRQKGADRREKEIRQDKPRECLRYKSPTNKRSCARFKCPAAACAKAMSRKKRPAGPVW